MRQVEIRARAKVNLFLRVLAREASGYHRIESLFCGVELGDRVRVEELEGRKGPRIRVESPWDVGPDEENLALRAAVLFSERIGEPELGLGITLKKEVPPGAGLGGGSSDAAAVLRAANHLRGAPLSMDALLGLGASLGSDVSFFLAPTPLALAWGRGERILSLPPLAARPVVLLVPPFSVATSDAYAALSRRREGAWSSPEPRILRGTELGSWEGIESLLENDFEEVVFGRHPELEAAGEELLSLGATSVCLTGTGSALFGLFPPEGPEEGALGRLEEQRSAWRVIATRTLARWADDGNEASGPAPSA